VRTWVIFFALYGVHELSSRGSDPNMHTIGQHFGLMCLAVLARVLTSAAHQPHKFYTCGAMHSPHLGPALPWCEEGDVVAGERWARHTWPWGPQHGTLALRGGREVRVGGREVCLSRQHCRELPCQCVNACASANCSWTMLA
jgi:hypothetical protein